MISGYIARATRRPHGEGIESRCHSGFITESQGCRSGSRRKQPSFFARLKMTAFEKEVSG